MCSTGARSLSPSQFSPHEGLEDQTEDGETSSSVISLHPCPSKPGWPPPEDVIASELWMGGGREGSHSVTLLSRGSYVVGNARGISANSHRQGNNLATPRR